MNESCWLRWMSGGYGALSTSGATTASAVLQAWSKCCYRLSLDQEVLLAIVILVQREVQSMVQRAVPQLQMTHGPCCYMSYCLASSTAKVIGDDAMINGMLWI